MADTVQMGLILQLLQQQDRNVNVFQRSDDDTIYPMAWYQLDGSPAFSTALVTLPGFQCLCTATDAFHKLSHYPNLVIGQTFVSAEQFQQDFKTESMHAAPTR